MDDEGSKQDNQCFSSKSYDSFKFLTNATFHQKEKENRERLEQERFAGKSIKVQIARFVLEWGVFSVLFFLIHT